MREIPPILYRTPLFRGIGSGEIGEALTLLEAREAVCRKQQRIFSAGSRTHDFGLLLEGSAWIVQEDFWGNRNIVAALSPGQLFAESFACAPQAALTVSVEAQAPCRVLFLRADRLLAAGAGSTAARLTCNLLGVLAEKNRYFNEKLTHMSQRSIREKLLSFLSAEALRQNRTVFEIPYNRQQLADYLSVDRSALSRELGRLQEEGILRFNRSRFELLRVGAKSGVRRSGKQERL